MALFIPRTIDEIFTELLLDKQLLSSIDGLDPDSVENSETLIQALNAGKAAEWVIWLYNMATQVHITEVRTESAVTDINALFATKRVHTEAWYIEKMLEFQVDDDLVINPFTKQVTYNPIDLDARIVGSCTTKPGQTLRLKVRKDVDNIFSEDEMTQLQTYSNTIKDAGTQTKVENFEGDEFTLNMTILYDGTKNLVTVTSDVESIINAYLDNPEPDGKFITSSLIDNLQAYEDIIDPRFDGGIALDSVGNEVAFIHEYQTNAGWALVNPLTPLSATVTYLPRTKTN